MSIVYYSRQTSSPASYIPRLLDQLAKDRVNSVSVVFPIYTDSVTSNSVHVGPDTPSDSALSYLIRAAHSRAMTVMLRPLLDESNLPSPDWRGTLRPASPVAWFANYQSLIGHYGQLAQSLGVEMLNIGSELNSMEVYSDSWRGLINALRGGFAGKITYAANWQGYHTGFWSALDIISFDAYFPLNATSATVDALASAWTPAIDKVRQAIAPFGKPLMFTEVGVQSRVNAYREPWNRTNAPVDLSEQAAYYQATCRASQNLITGTYWWGVYLIPPPDPTHDGDFTPLGKPAETAMRDCFSART